MHRIYRTTAPAPRTSSRRTGVEVPHLIVLGHGMCGGVRSLLEGVPDGAGISWRIGCRLRNRPGVRVALCATVQDRQQFCEREVIKVSLANLMTYPWIADRVATGRLELHGAWFAIHSGVLMRLSRMARLGQPDRFEGPGLATASYRGSRKVLQHQGRASARTDI